MAVKFIENGLTFDDVLIVPKRSSIFSRGDVSLKTRLVGDLTLDLPIISANMDTVTELDMATAMAELGGMGVIHRFIEDPRLHAEWVSRTPGHRFLAVGVKPTDLEKIPMVDDLHGLVIDVAHGHSDRVTETVADIRKAHPRLWVIAGNVATAEGAWDLLEAGAHAIKVGVGPGAVCLGMATPLAMIRGGGMAARKGILMRSGEAFQVLKDVKKVVLGKTGTITRGEPAVVEVVALGGYDEDEALRLAAAAENASEHPLARAVVDAAEEREISVPEADNFQSVAGKGVTAGAEGRSLAVGSPRFVEGEGVELGPAREQVEALQEAGNTVVALAVDGELTALIAFADRIKDDAIEAIERLKAAGLDPVMLTGDNERTARAVAHGVGIEEYRAEVLPDDKAKEVRDLQEQGHRVIMVGDGINDAPALMQADVGMIGAGTDIAIESADVVLIGERLEAVVDTYHIGQNSYRKTVQNLSLAFAFNGIGVPLAVTGLVHPIWAMAAMIASVTAVLTNSFAGQLLPQSRRMGEDQEPEGREARLTLKIPNMRCEHCLESIREAVCKLDGVEDAGGDLEGHEVTVTYRQDEVEPDGIREAIVERGFQVDGVGPASGRTREKVA